MIGCEYCRRQRAFWAWNADGSVGSLDKQHVAHIVAGTNAFLDTAGRQMNFRYCPMCGESLLNPPDDGGGISLKSLLPFFRRTAIAQQKQKERVISMANKRSESGYYWVDKSITCNGCKYLNFYKCGCRRGMPPGEVRPLSTYKNGDDYVAVLKPTDCDYQKEQKKQAETVSTEKAS